jgi:hypothetical protein
MSTGSAVMRVRGAASAEQLAALVAVLCPPARSESGYERWRLTRLAALRADHREG